MHVRRLILVALALALPAPAAHAEAPADVRVLSCTPWEEGEGGSVTYEARMRAVPGTERMALRIRLLEKFGDGDFHRVSGRVWRKSRPRVEAFNWEHHVDGLRQGGNYRAVVHYRWYGADGERIRSARVRSQPCKQPGRLPNLRVASVETRRGDVEGTAVYRVQIVNRGASEARRVGVLLRVDGEVVDELEVIEAIGPDEVQTVTFNGPVCRRHLRVVVDPKELIPETREQDNVRAPTCL
jgi:hypothetical protein